MSGVATTGHHPEHVGLQKHSVGGIYPLAVVGYGNGDLTTYCIEHLTEGKVLCDATGLPYQSESYNVIYGVAASGFDDDLDMWVKGRPHLEANMLVM